MLNTLYLGKYVIITSNQTVKRSFHSIIRNFPALIVIEFAGVLLCAAGSFALYDSSSDVVELTPSNFDKLVTNSDEIWIVEFFAPWCGHCKNLVPEYKKAAKALKVHT